MAETLGITATICAFFSGSILGGALFNHYRSARLKASMKALLGSSSIVDALSISLESQGIGRRVLIYAIELSRREDTLANPLSSLLVSNWQSSKAQIERAGLENFISRSGMVATKLRLSLIGGASGALIGVLFSTLLAVVGLVLGGLWGLTCLSRALKQEAQSRSLLLKSIYHK